MILYFDTETTGLNPGQICQLSYVMQTDCKTVAKNFFFMVDSIEAGAQAVHGFSVQKLKTLSGGKTFADSFFEIANDFASAELLVSHNTAFDLGFLRAEFERLGQILSDYNVFCSMKNSVDVCKIKRKSGGYKYPKLNELCAFLGVSDFEIAMQCKKLFDSTVGFHDARFDTTAVYLAVNSAIAVQEKFKNLKQYIR